MAGCVLKQNHTQKNKMAAAIWTLKLIPIFHWWAKFTNLTQGLKWSRPKPSMKMITDASLDAWGAHINQIQGSGSLNTTPKNLSHQCGGTSCCSERSQSVSTSSKEQVCPICIEWLSSSLRRWFKYSAIIATVDYWDRYHTWQTSHRNGSSWTGISSVWIHFCLPCMPFQHLLKAPVQRVHSAYQPCCEG